VFRFSGFGNGGVDLKDDCPQLGKAAAVAIVEEGEARGVTDSRFDNILSRAGVDTVLTFDVAQCADKAPPPLLVVLRTLKPVLTMWPEKLQHKVENPDGPLAVALTHGVDS
jgi:hypothetical protein